jgi:hypothetical protein
MAQGQIETTWLDTYSNRTKLTPVKIIDYRCDNRRFWLSAHNCQVLTPTSQSLDLEQQIRIFEAELINCLEE